MNGRDEAVAHAQEKGDLFYGWDTADVRAVSPDYPGVGTPADLYGLLLSCWCAETCAPRMRAGWSKENPTLGQCSVTAFLAQEIFGGKVYGIPLPEGGFHCYNDVDGRVFDLTCGQFRGRELWYRDNPEQSRETHFSSPEKYERYLLLRKKLLEALAGKA